MDRSPFQTSKLRLEESGAGTLQYFNLFPGIELSRTHLSSEHILLEHAPLSGILEVNYCHKGRIGWGMAEGTTVYLGPGDLEIHTMDLCAVSAISLPLRYYEGITVTLDLDDLERHPLPFLQESGICGHELRQKLCPNGVPLALPASPAISHIFDPLYHVSDRLWLPCCKLKVLELLLFLENLVPDQEKQVGRYYSGQVETIKEIHRLLTSDLRARYTIDELSRKYLINSAALKSGFKAVYSQPIGSYMKEYRLRRAMELLRQEEISIAEIAEQVGYESQGNFAEAFKSFAHISPSEYRKAYRPHHVE